MADKPGKDPTREWLYVAEDTYRLMVETGYLYRHVDDEGRSTMCFVPYEDDVLNVRPDSEWVKETTDS